MYEVSWIPKSYWSTVTSRYSSDLNGGGKTNLLDATLTTLRKHLFKSWSWSAAGVPGVPNRRQFQQNDRLSTAALERHTGARDKDQIIEVEIEVSAHDIANIIAMREKAKRGPQNFGYTYVGGSIDEAANWDEISAAAGDRLTFVMRNDSLAEPSTAGAQLVRSYLGLFDIDRQLREDADEAPLSMPMLSLPVNRASSGFASSVALSSFNESDHKREVDAATSRSNASLVGMAVGRMATTFRRLLEEDKGRAKSEFYEQPQIKALSKSLALLGYEWELESVNMMTNQYDVRLTKQGSSFLVGDASSGEKELLNYLFAVYGLGVRDALVVIDEPELHLHPKWQTTLLRLFENLADQTGNQFLMATHSPVFVSPSSIQYVSRVFSERQKNHIVRLNDAKLPNARHLFSIVNSQNKRRYSSLRKSYWSRAFLIE